MPPKKLTKTSAKVTSAKKSEGKVKDKSVSAKALKKEDIDLDIDDDLSGEEVEDAEDGEEEFFNRDSYMSFAKKYDIEKISSDYYVNNDLHKVDVIVPKDLRRTSEIMSYAEYARVIAERAKQIENGSPMFIESKNEHSPINIAEKEVRQKMCPLKIIRYLTKNIKEEWSVNEMIIPFGINSD